MILQAMKKCLLFIPTAKENYWGICARKGYDNEKIYIYIYMFKDNFGCWENSILRTQKWKQEEQMEGSIKIRRFELYW